MLRRVLRHPLTCLVLTLVVGGVLMLGVEPSAHALFHGLGPEGYALGVRPLLSGLLYTLLVLAVGRLLERKRPEELGLGLHGAGRDLGRGVLVGVALMGGLVALLALLGWYALPPRPPETAAEEAREALFYLVGFGGVAYHEELVMRGIVFRLVEDWLGSAAALLVSSALFGVLHAFNPDATWFSSVAIMLEAGLLLGAAYMLTRSLWFAVGIHWAWNWVQGPLFGIDVSGMEMDGVLDGALTGPVAWTGGAFGVEGGWLALLVSTLAGAALTGYAARRGQWRPWRSWRAQRRAARRVEAVRPAPPPAPPPA